MPCPHRDGRGENFLFVLNDESLGLKDTLNSAGDFVIRKTVDAIENPYGFDHRHDTNEAWLFFRKVLFDDLGGLPRLNRVILREVAHKHIRIEPRHRFLVPREPATAPAAIASCIAVSETRRRVRDEIMPFNTEV